MSLTKIVVSGRVIKSPEKRFTPNNNVAVTEFAIAVESAPRQDGSKETTAVKVVTWRDLAERCSQEIKKGDLVCVDGRLQINTHTTSDGLKRRDAEIDAISVENLSSVGAGSADAVPATQDKVPQTVGAPAQASEDLDMIFASEDEIPF
ncbi:MAG: single-stranded DNA-binding protein [Candidatus Melainabacteria bacterium]|nr:single-stranded DNA-binding protein [Candidatus Melainabacteria bacterium]